MSKIKPNKKILIIGAAIAGLAACKYLNEHGFDTRILEARNYCGGRIKINHDLGVPIAEGALFIHGIDGNPITELAQTFHAEMRKTNPSTMVMYGRDNKPVSLEKSDEFRTIFDAFLQQAKNKALASAQDMSLDQALSTIIDKNDLTDLEQDLLLALTIFHVGYFAASSEALSARHWDQDEGWTGDNVFLINSYENIINGLALSCSVTFDAVVKKINLHKDQVEIVTQDSVFTADAVIVTVPLGVLKQGDIEFNPCLPLKKQQAISHLAMGLLNLLVMRFPNAFWSEANQSMLFTSFDDESFPTFMNLQKYTNEPILIGFSGGDSAKHIEAMSDEEVIAKTISNFKKVFGDDVPHPESFFRTRWFTDPFSYGSYSFTPVGGSSEDYEELGKPVDNRLFFAGEATSVRHPATTHGAYLSGIREAERITRKYSS
jgi:polyamine oxidase